MKKRMSELKTHMLIEAKRANLWAFEDYIRRKEEDWFFDVFVLSRNSRKLDERLCYIYGHLCECFIKAWMWDNKIRYVYGEVDRKAFPKTYPRIFVIRK